MARTWRQCDHCLTWSTDAVKRTEFIESGRMCSDCVRHIGTRTLARASWDDAHAPPQEGGRDLLQKFKLAVDVEL